MPRGYAETDGVRRPAAGGRTRRAWLVVQPALALGALRVGVRALLRPCLRRCRRRLCAVPRRARLNERCGERVAALLAVDADEVADGRAGERAPAPPEHLRARREPDGDGAG